jgi:hypothetical protein
MTLLLGFLFFALFEELVVFLLLLFLFHLF